MVSHAKKFRLRWFFGFICLGLALLLLGQWFSSSSSTFDVEPTKAAQNKSPKEALAGKTSGNSQKKTPEITSQTRPHAAPAIPRLEHVQLDPRIDEALAHQGEPKRWQLQALSRSLNSIDEALGQIAKAKVFHAQPESLSSLMKRYEEIQQVYFDALARLPQEPVNRDAQQRVDAYQLALKQNPDLTKTQQQDLKRAYLLGDATHENRGGR